MLSSLEIYTQAGLTADKTSTRTGKGGILWERVNLRETVKPGTVDIDPAVDNRRREESLSRAIISAENHISQGGGIFLMCGLTFWEGERFSSQTTTIK